MKRCAIWRGGALFLLLLLVMNLFACDAGNPSPDETSGAVSDGEIETVEPSEIKIDELSSYRIIYREDGTDEELTQVLALQAALRQAYGVTLDMREDFLRAGTSYVESGYEIVVGRCAREATEAYCRGLRADDYGYCVSGKKLLITGLTAEGTVKAVKAFLSDVVGKGDGVLLSSENGVTVRGSYDVSPVYLSGVELSEYAIVYPQGDARLEVAADYLAEQMSAMLGYYPLVKNDGTAATSREILLGETARGLSESAPAENEYVIAALGESVVLAGGSATMVYRASDRLVELLVGGKPENGRLVLTIETPIRTVCDTETLRAMSFNIRCAEFTESRIALVFRMIDLYAPDTIGFQEATVSWMNRLKSYLGDRYGCIGVGRNSDFSGEASPVFYLKSKFELLDSGTRWMTPTPDVPGSKIEESTLPRVYSYAVLRTIDTGVIFVHVNTHLEHTSEAAREIQIGYLIEFLKDYRDKGMSCIVTGDFNCQAGAGSYSAMLSAGFEDSLYIAEEAVMGTTYHGYGTTSKVIDHIFVTGAIDVLYYKACTETFKNSDGSVAYPSDHNPVIIDYEIAG